MKIVEYVGAINEEDAHDRANGKDGYGSWSEEERKFCDKFVREGERLYRVTTIIEKVKP